MIFFANSKGTIIKTLPSSVYQGSENASELCLVAPFSQGMQVTVHFKLPNGVWTKPSLMRNGLPANAMTRQGEIIDNETDKQYAVWSYTLPGEITNYYGTVTAQFFFYTGQEGVIVSTGAANFTVERGVPAVLPKTPSDDIYGQILDNLSNLRTDLENGYYAARSIYAWDDTYEYGANEIVFYPDEGDYGVFVRSKNTENKNNPPYVDGVLDTTWWELVIDFDQLHKAIVIWGFNEPVAVSDLEWTEN